MYDPYSEPDYNPGGGAVPQQGRGGFSMPNFDGQGGPNLSFAKYIPLLVIVLIVLIVGFFAFTWLTSQQTVTIKILNSEKDDIPGRIILKDSKGATIATTPKIVASTFTATLWPGEYSVSATAEGYSPSSTTCSISADNTNCNISLTRNLSATITTTLANSPTEIYVGQTISGQLQVTNTGPEFDTTDIVLSDGNFFTVTLFQPQTTTLTQGSSIFIDFNIKIKDTAKVTKSQNANITFKIKGSTVKSSPLAIIALPTVKLSDVRVTGTISKTSLTAGKEESVDITIKNNNKEFPIKDLIIEVIANTGDENFLSWISFAGETGSEKNKKIVDEIAPNSSVKITILIKPELSSKIGDELKGILQFTTTTVSGEITPLNINLKVSIEKEVKLELKGTTTPFIIDCTASTCETQEYVLTTNPKIYFVNTGDVAIEDITVEINLAASSANCTSYLTTFKTHNTADTTKIVSIAPNSAEKAAIWAVMTSPTNAVNDASATCVIDWRYKDPINPIPTTIPGTGTIQIITSVN